LERKETVLPFGWALGGGIAIAGGGGGDGGGGGGGDGGSGGSGGGTFRVVTGQEFNGS